MLERRAAHSTGSCAPLWLQRADKSPLARVEERYGAAEEMARNLEAFIWAAGRLCRQSGRLAPLVATWDGVVVDAAVEAALGAPAPLHTRTWADLEALLGDITAYSALGALGGADQRVCDALQPLLLRLLKLLLSGAVVAEESGHDNDNDHDDDGDSNGDGLTLVDQIVTAAEHATANCSTGVARRTADTTLVVDGDRLAEQISANSDGDCPRWLPGPGERLAVTFGFADYSTSETAALLWAGAIGLSAFLMEKLDVVWSMLPPEQRRRTRVLELGCGPALVSLTLAQLLLRHWSAQTAASSPCTAGTDARILPSAVHLDVTDLSPAAVEEARRSFEHRNGPELARVLADDEGEALTAAADVDGLRVYTRQLDMGTVPADCVGQYGLIVASDIVYDDALTRLVTPALVALLAPGGIAVLCCEAHRDSMSGFLPHVRAHYADTLTLELDILNVDSALQWVKTDKSLSESSCRLMILRRVA